ncbi:MAG: glycosyltransferase family 2 protein [Alphaproteobacteria bacterium]|nr:glycosyltransferase family 2 protein [Alphaproteobacteria bacterium]
MKKSKITYPILFIVFFICGYFCFEEKKPIVSVVLPTYNRAQLLPRAIESILNQEFQDFELIIVDDCSTDNTLELLKSYQEKSDKIIVIKHDTTQGVGSARNTGNDYARGKYIIILDSDDYALPNMLKDSVEFMIKHPSVDLGVPAKKAFYEKNPNKLFPWHYPVYNFLNGNQLGNVGNIFKREFVVKHNIKYKTYYTCAEDYDFWIQMILNGATVAKIEDDNNKAIYTTAFMTHKNTYGSACFRNSLNVKKDIATFLNLPETPIDMCMWLKKLININPHLFLPHTKKDALIAFCPPENGTNFIQAYHPLWMDYLVFSSDTKKVSRYRRADTATVITYKPQELLTLKWDKFGTETFIYNIKTKRYDFQKKH